MCICDNFLYIQETLQKIKSVGFDFNVLAYLIVDQHSRSTIIFFFYVQLPSNTELAAF